MVISSLFLSPHIFPIISTLFTAGTLAVDKKIFIFKLGMKQRTLTIQRERRRRCSLLADDEDDNDDVDAVCSRNKIYGKLFKEQPKKEQKYNKKKKGNALEE